jgi:DNA ligase (NAD+)
MRTLLDNASKMYYEGTPVMSDASFDILSAHFDYDMLGHHITDGLPHYHRMYSLQNVFDTEEFPTNINDYVTSPKLDGAAIAILYVNGQLTLACTRGDGIHGRDITEKIKTLVPNTITSDGIVQITGEVIAPKSIPNARNYAAGALNLTSMTVFGQRDLTFVAYDQVEHGFNLWTQAMLNLEAQGFNVVTKFDVSDFPTDGTVYRIDELDKFRALGHTSKHPRGAFAHKVQAAGVVTKLLNVIWQVGKSGVVSPVAILKPVKVGDATVSKATLHNIKYIHELELEIGCNVEVIRSGEVIPRVVRRV